MIVFTWSLCLSLYDRWFYNPKSKLGSNDKDSIKTSFIPKHFIPSIRTMNDGNILPFAWSFFLIWWRDGLLQMERGWKINWRLIGLFFKEDKNMLGVHANWLSDKSNKHQSPKSMKSDKKHLSRFTLDLCLLFSYDNSIPLKKRKLILN